VRAENRTALHAVWVELAAGQVRVVLAAGAGAG